MLKKSDLKVYSGKEAMTNTKSETGHSKHLFKRRLRVTVISTASTDSTQFDRLFTDRDAVVRQLTTDLNGGLNKEFDEGTDLIVLSLGESDWSSVLDWASNICIDQYSDILVVGPAENVDIVRRSMQLGAKDFLERAVSAEDFHKSIDKLQEHIAKHSSQESASIISVINAKGGSGATFIATNLAHILADASKSKAALVDLDVQFGTTAQYLDLYPDMGLMEVLDSIEEMDGLALEGHMQKHESGLRLMSLMPEKVVLPEEISAQKLTQFFNLMAKEYQHIVVDLPRQIDHMTAMAMERSDHIILVVQQSLSHLKDATRMINILRNEIGIPNNRVNVVVNRYDKRSEITLDDIDKAMKVNVSSVIPNDYTTVCESLNSGEPLFAYAKSSAVTHALMRLETRLGGNSMDKEEGFMSRLMHKVRGQ